MNPDWLILAASAAAAGGSEKPYHLVDYMVFYVDFSCVFRPAMTLFRHHTASLPSALPGRLFAGESKKILLWCTQVSLIKLEVLSCQ
jgi:hypothetical protein